MRALRLLSLFGLLSLAGAGCSEFHYYDINVKLGGFIGNEPTLIQVITITVSGADSGSMRIGANNRGLPLAPGDTELGVVEFSTYADSGTLNFKGEAFDATATTADCRVGEGTVAITAGSATTSTGELTITKGGSNFTCSGGTN